ASALRVAVRRAGAWRGPPREARREGGPAADPARQRSGRPQPPDAGGKKLDCPGSSPESEEPTGFASGNDVDGGNPVGPPCCGNPVGLPCCGNPVGCS